MDIEEFESAVWEVEGIHITIRADTDTEVEDYNYERALAGTTSLKKWATSRIEPLLGDLEYVIYDGSLDEPHRRTSLRNVRDSYED